MKVHGPDSVDLNQVLTGRKNKKTFFWFLDEIATVVVGSVVVERVNCTQLPREWMTPSLEAFSLLCLENFFERVRSQITNSDPPVRAKWTEGRGSKKFQGWSQPGIQRYNELLDKVREDRKRLRKVEEAYLKHKKDERMTFESEKLKKRQETNENGDEIITANDDFTWSEAENDSGSDGDENDSETDE
jgi:hypothetical protein